ncbi:sulfate ABC transporter permease subunit CysT [Asticcacaulis sp. 201]|uniref:sulfate ABC transporter permease subunit CysT n=1 Tax=Asticcacaulis sp. 201 TaxID=3028787 RepID=UPI002915CAE1|nr:sulfate ABC transporter permease subunit CysT [Asticcacaulis sp. 201]MDV6332829.1 sulfate ABC transporter permease subunit CysT [Asticcacaulis sp. 201]
MTGQPDTAATEPVIPDHFQAPHPAKGTTRVLPGFKITLGLTLFYLSAIVIIPLIALVARPWEHGWQGFQFVLTDTRVLHALYLSFITALAAAVVNAFAGLAVAWVLTRYNFPGRKLLDALIDLPFALPTAVAGIALSSLYASNGWIGSITEPLGLKIAYTPIGIFLALTFIGLPFVVRSVQPVLAEFEAEVEEAAETLGATDFQTAFRVILPALMPSLVTGFSLALARGVGEYGSVIFIAGNMPYVSEIAPLLIVIKLQEFDYAGAASVGVIMLAMSLAILLVLNLTQRFFANVGSAK